MWLKVITSKLDTYLSDELIMIILFITGKRKIF